MANNTIDQDTHAILTGTWKWPISIWRPATMSPASRSPQLSLDDPHLAGDAGRGTMGYAAPTPRSTKSGRTVSETRERAIIGSIYDAALEPEEWPSALAALSEYARTREAFIALIDRQTTGFPLHATAHVAQELAADFFERWATPERNLWLRARTTTAPVGRCLNMDRVVPRSRLERSDYFRELLVPWHMERSAGGVLFQLPTVTAVYATYRSARGPDFDHHDEALLDRFLPHLRRAVGIHRRLSAREGILHISQH